LVLLSFLVVDVGGVPRDIAVAAGFGFFTVDAAVLLRVMMPGDDDDDGVMFPCAVGISGLVLCCSQ